MLLPFPFLVFLLEIIDLHTEVETHFAQNLTDFIQRFSAEVFGLKHFAFSLLHQFAYKIDILVIGGGQAGLSSAYHLHQMGLAGGRGFLVLDKSPRLVQEWVDVGLVVRYEWKEGPVLFFPGFRKHNSGIEYAKDKPESRFPPPPGWHRSRLGLIPDDEEAAFRLSEDFHIANAYAQELREKNDWDAVRAVVNAASIRLRPRVMTTITTMVGFLPLALNLEEGGDMLQPMAMAAIGGLGMEMLVALFFMPCLYVLVTPKH